QVSRFLSNYFSFIGEYHQAIAAAQRVLALAMRSGDGVQGAFAYQYLGRAYYAQGDYHQAMACLGQALASFEGVRRHELFGQVILPAVISRVFLAWCHAELGTFTEGRGFGEEGLQIAEMVAHPGSLMVASWGIGLLAFRQGDLPRALPLLEQARRIADAVPLLTRALEESIAMARVDIQAFCRLSLGEAQLLTGHLEKAHAFTEQALAHARAHQERSNEAYALRLLGDIAARCNPPEHNQAAIHYRQALALAEELGMRPLQAHCHRGLGTLYATTGQREQARTALAAAIDLYRAMDMTFWLPQAEAALAQAESQ